MTRRAQSRVTEGRPFPLGATWDGLGVNFALFSAHATKVELCLFDAQGKRELEFSHNAQSSDVLCLYSHRSSIRQLPHCGLRALQT